MGKNLAISLFCLALLATFAFAQEQGEQAEKPEGPVSTPTRVETSVGGIVMIRSSRTRPAPPPAEEAPAEGEAAAEPAAEPGAKEEPAKPKPSGPVSRFTAGYKRDASGRMVRGAATGTSTQTDGSGSQVQRANSAGGRSVPYLSQERRIVSSAGGTEVSEDRTQRYSPDGQPTRQELTRTETRKMPDGSVRKTSTVYREDINGRMQPVEREVVTEKTRGNTTETVSTLEHLSINGGFAAVKRETSVEKKLDENRSTIETVRTVSDGSGPMKVSEREQTTMSKQGAVSTTETEIQRADTLTGAMKLAERKVGTLQEQPDGSIVEKVETYGLTTASGATNINASRPVLQEVLERNVTVSADGRSVERTSVRALSQVTGQFGSASITEKVSSPTGDGEHVRTDLYEPDANGRLVPTQSTIEEVRQ